VSFWWKCFLLAFAHWERGEPVLTQITPLFGTYVAVATGVVTTAQADAISQSVWVAIAWVPLAIMLLLVSPYRLWKQKADKLEQLTQKRVELSLDDIRLGSDESSYWQCIQVVNCGAEAIPDCYAILQSFEQLSSKAADAPNRLPHPGLRLPWAKSAGEHAGQFLAVIPPYPNPICFDFVHTRGIANPSLYVSSPTRGQGIPELDAFPLPPGSYKFVVEVGTTSRPGFRGTTLTLRVKYSGGHKFEVECSS